MISEFIRDVYADELSADDLAAALARAAAGSMEDVMKVYERQVRAPLGGLLGGELLRALLLQVAQHGQRGRLGGAVAGHHGLLGLNRKAWGRPRPSGGEAQCLRSHREAVALAPRRTKSHRLHRCVRPCRRPWHGPVLRGDAVPRRAVGVAARSKCRLCEAVASHRSLMRLHLKA